MKLGDTPGGGSKAGVLARVLRFKSIMFKREGNWAFKNEANGGLSALVRQGQVNSDGGQQ